MTSEGNQLLQKPSQSPCPHRKWSATQVPWPIWVTVVMLTLFGIGDLISISSQPQSLDWFISKVLFVVGLLAGCRIVYIYALFEVIVHVIVFSGLNDFFVAALNLVILILMLVSIRYFFPKIGSAVT